MNHTKTLAIVGILAAGLLGVLFGTGGLVQKAYAQVGTFSTGAVANGYSAAGASGANDNSGTATSSACTGPNFSFAAGGPDEFTVSACG
jgi:hypothetical protein